MIWGRGSSISHKTYPSRRKTIREHGYKECRVGSVSRAVKVRKEGRNQTPTGLEGALMGGLILGFTTVLEKISSSEKIYH